MLLDPSFEPESSSVTPPEQDPETSDLSREEERDRILAETLEHVTARDAAFRRLSPEVERPAPWKVPLALLFLLTAAYVAASPPAWLTPAPAPELAAAALERGARAALFLQAQEIDAYRALHGDLPASLEELPARFPDVRFVRSDNHVYQLVTRGSDGSNLVYDSAHPGPAFATALGAWPGDPRP